MSLAQDSMVALRAESGPELVPIDRITCGPSVRGGGLSETHVEVLTELNGAWPPIVVWGDQNLVVDGADRLAAARRLNLRQLAVVHVGGTSDDAFVESVRRNIEHGLPLSLPDRRRAARQLLQFHPNWSDRANWQNMRLVRQDHFLASASGPEAGRGRGSRATSRAGREDPAGWHS